MGISEKKMMRRRLVSAYLSSLLSISLVLLLVGMASLLLVNAGNVTAYFKEKMQLSVIFKQQTTERQAKSFTANLSAQAYAKTVEYVSREQGMEEMKALLGEDFLSVFDTAPIPLSADVSLVAEYVTPERVDSLVTVLTADPLVDDVVWQRSLVEKLNSNLSTVSMVVSIFVALLLFISFVLINNTVRLNIFTKRFTIHTMRLVGATKAFIGRPFMVMALLQGILSSLLAFALMMGALFFVKRQFALLFTVFRTKELLEVFGIMTLSGIVICCVTTFFVVNRLIDVRKEELYY